MILDENKIQELIDEFKNSASFSIEQTAPTEYQIVRKRVYDLVDLVETERLLLKIQTNIVLGKKYNIEEDKIKRSSSYD
jgi:hypothetical protein